MHNQLIKRQKRDYILNFEINGQANQLPNEQQLESN